MTRALALTVFILASPALAQTNEAPLSAIDWLSQSVEQPRVVNAPPATGSRATRPPQAGEAPVARSATTPKVSVQPLGRPGPRVLGILPASSTGFDVDLWQNSDAATLAALLAAEEIDTVPALQDLLTRLILTRANPMAEGGDGDAFFLARVDKLLDFGALNSAQAMLDSATPDTPTLFQRWFDVSLLNGTENRACRSLRDKPDVAPTPSARVFCLARLGDWPAAVLTLNTGLALGDIGDAEGALLARFLDPDLFEGEPELIPPARITPLTFRMFEAIGAPLSTRGLPRAFAHADLRDNVGWKAQLEAAERLSRAGAIAPADLIDLYTARVPAASGGVWERARAVARFEAALASDDAQKVTAALDVLWAEARLVGVSVPLAQSLAPRLMDVTAIDRSNPELDLELGTVFQFLLLSQRYEHAALNRTFAAQDPFLASLARGNPAQISAQTPDRRLVQAAFAFPADPMLVDLAATGQTGEAILRTIALMQQGLDGDEVAFKEGIATLRALGLEDVARRTALQFLILP